MARQVTLKDVARAAGIAPATASHALNRNGTVSKATADHVRRVAGELGYHRDQRAAGLRRQRTSTLGLLIPKMNDPFHAELAEAIESAARVRGYSLIGGTTNRDQQLEEHYLNLFLGHRCEGVIIIQGRQMPDAFSRAEVPTVLVNSHGPPELKGIPFVEVLDLQGMRMAVDHLIRIGHRRIALISFIGIEARTLGYRIALADAGIPHDPGLEVIGEHIDATAALGELFYRYLQGRPDITAVAAATDMAALAVIRAAHLLGRRVPDDLAVVGFDGIGIGAMVVPALTTMAQPITGIAVAAVDLLIEQIESGGDTAARRHVQLEATLVVRESCGGVSSPVRGQPQGQE